jgi:hypothetical protein
MEDKTIFTLMDSLEEADIQSEIKYPDGRLIRSDVDRIKKRTYAVLQTSPKKNKVKKMILAASVMLAVMLLSLAGPANVYANIQKALSFIPGFNVVVDSEELNNFVLSEAVSFESGDNKIDIVGAYVNGQKTILNIRGQHQDVDKEVYDRFSKDLVSNIYLIADDKKLSSFGSSIGMSSNSWEGTFIFDKVNDVESVYVHYYDSIISQEIVLQLDMKLARSYEDISLLGPNATVQDITIVAIPNFSDNSLVVNLANLGVQNGRVQSYVHEKIELVDEEGRSYPLSHRSSYSSPLSDFTFDLSEYRGGQLKLVIPEILITVYESTSVRIDIPDDFATLNKEFSVLEYTSRITTIKMDDDGNVIMDVDLYEDENIKLKSFSLQGMSYSSKLSEEFTIVSYRYVPKTFLGKQKLTFYNPRLIVYGPWELEISK